MANKALRAELEARANYKSQVIASTLKTAKKKHVRIPKRKNSVEVFDMLKLGRFEDKLVRPLDAYDKAYYNLDRQKIELTKWLYVRYQVPRFMYNLFLTDIDDRWKFDWFFCMAQGGSFGKLVKDVMTKKEAHAFLNQRNDDYSLEEAFWFIKATQSGVGDGIVRKLFDKQFFANFGLNSASVERLMPFLQWYAHYCKDMDSRCFEEVTDYLLHKRRTDAAFSLKGRTLTSVIALSNEWHRLAAVANADEKVKWDGYGWEPWIKEIYREKVIWEITELCTNHDLINEGRVQAHCVWSYTYACRNASTHVFSLRKYDAETLNEHRKSRITLEVIPGKIVSGQVVQARGRENRSATTEELAHIKTWAASHGLAVKIRKGLW